MNGRRAVSMVGVIGWLACGAAAGAQAPARPGVPVARASVDRTAAWVGDRVIYTVEIVCPKGTDVLDDDLAKDRLSLEGFEVVATDSARTEAADLSVTRQFRYALTTYDVNARTLRVAPLTVRYFATRPGQRLEESAPAGDVAVPGAVVAFRSTLPEAQETLALRDARAPAPRRTIYTLAQPIGIGLVVVSIVPVALLGIALAARRRPRPGRSRRHVRQSAQASLEAARAIDVSAPDGRREAYTQIDAIVRDHLDRTTGVTGRALTPAEVGPALAGQRVRVPSEEVSALLAECERARYGPPDALPSADACRDALARAEQLVAPR